jgi:pyrroloquinoline quinone biosynthesis protein E
MSASGYPIGILAELTHRCPLQCPYCSNPASLLKGNAELDTDTWLRVFEEAADLGILQVHLSGGEPTVRTDLEDIVSLLASRGVYTNLITAGINVKPERIEALKHKGLDHVQLSVQGATPEVTELIGNMKGAFEHKMTTARAVREAGLPLTINAPVHRHNIHQVDDFINLALELDADRLEIANVQYYGWALINRTQLMPAWEDVTAQVDLVEAARERLRGILLIDFVTPDYYAKFPKPCMGGWARDAFMIAPDGTAMPCHAAHTIPHLEFDNVKAAHLAEIWNSSPAFEAYRGTEWMKEPCRSCDRRNIDYGGCRCQAFAITEDATAADPACSLSPDHAAMEAIVKRGQAGAEAAGGFTYRRVSGAPG